MALDGLGEETGALIIFGREGTGWQKSKKKSTVETADANDCLLYEKFECLFGELKLQKPDSRREQYFGLIYERKKAPNWLKARVDKGFKK